MSRLTLMQANTIIERGFARAREMKIKPLAIVVLDDSGNIVSAQREDGASMFRIDIATAQGKFLPQTGAVLIRNAQGEILGAAGASGGTGEEDEACCIYGIEQAGLIADASA